MLGSLKLKKKLLKLLKGYISHVRCFYHNKKREKTHIRDQSSMIKLIKLQT